MLNGNFTHAPPRIFLGRAALVAAGIAAVGAATAAGAIRCPFAQLLGVPCPACGSKRTVVALLTGHRDLAHLVNPLAPIAAVLLVVLAVRVVALVALQGHVRGVGEGAFGRMLTRALFAVAMLEIALWALRWFGLFGGPVPT